MRPRARSIEEVDWKIDRARLQGWRDGRLRALSDGVAAALKAWSAPGCSEMAQDVLDALEGRRGVSVGPHQLLRTLRSLGVPFRLMPVRSMLRVDAFENSLDDLRLRPYVLDGICIDASERPYGGSVAGRLRSLLERTGKPVAVRDLTGLHRPPEFADWDRVRMPLSPQIICSEARRAGLSVRRYGRGMMLLPKSVA